MTADDRIYDLLPAIHRLRDAEQGYPLRTVLRVIARQMSYLEASIGELYDDWFIETCQDWVVPYLADLVGIALGPAPAAPGRGSADPVAAGLRRRQTANALADRRAKGTLAVLERLAADTTGWPARATELGPLVAITQSARHPDLARGRLIDTRDGDRVGALGTAFDREATVADTRSASASRLTAPRNLPAVSVALWRLVNDDTGRGPAMCVNDDNHYTFDPLGRDVQLCVRPVPRAPGTHPAGDLDVPAPISRPGLERRPEAYYGPDRSLCVYRRSGPVHRTEIVAADLSGWRYRPRPGKVAVDPVLGRIVFPERQAPEGGVWVRYSRLRVGQLGGGHYGRGLTAPPPATAVYRVGPGALGGVSEALRSWETDRAAGRAGARAAIEIADDRVYQERLRIGLHPGQHLEIRAADGCRPVLRPVDRQRNRPQSLLISGEAAAAERMPGQPPSVVLDGVWVAGHSVELAGELGTVTLRHCSLIPGRDHDEPGQWRDGLLPGLVAHAAPCRIVIDHSVVGRVTVDSPEEGFDPLPLVVADSVLDAAEPAGDAVGGPDGRPAYVTLNARRVTVLGGASVHQVGGVEDAVFTGRLHAARRQVGAIRFSYVPEGSVTPRRTRCQPDGVVAAAADEAGKALAAARVAPRFDDTSPTAPAYARLADGTAAEIVTGASDEGEMGAFHDLWAGLRARSLDARIAEFTPVDADIGVQFAS